MLIREIRGRYLFDLPISRKEKETDISKKKAHPISRVRLMFRLRV